MSKIKSNINFKELILHPENVIEKLDLIYIDHTKLNIIREKNKKTFIFRYGDKIIEEEKEIERFNSLVIPPAWQKVKISSIANSHLQATGRDVKNRKQYRYHPRWNLIRNQTKFYKMSLFGENIPKIRKQIDIDLNQAGWPKSKVVALVLKLMEETHIRIGNEQYAKRNKTYGLSTLRTKHVKTYREKINFEFIGKRGKEHKVSIRNKKLIKLIHQCEEIPGWELFQYFDENGEKQSVESSMINEYVQSVCGTLFTAKDFRTWGASISAFNYLNEVGLEKEKNQQHKNVLSAYDSAAMALGNTRNVCKKYYVHPAIIEQYEDHSIKKYFELAEVEKNKEYFTDSESAMLLLFQTYMPNFKV